MAQKISSNKRIAKNTIMLYIRMLIATIVGLYTTRIVLQILGVEDYGIYGVVGSITAMLGFLKSSMSSSTSRFLAFELGNGNQEKLRLIFSSSMIIHIILAILIVILGESIGLWFLENKLVIPEGRMDAARWVLNTSIVSAAVTITQVPYNSCIIAHEKMSVYAYIEIINVTLKLLIVYLLTIGNYDKLKLYSSLVLVVTIIISLIYRIYCRKYFKETSILWVWEKGSIKRIMNFSVWQMFSSLCMSLKQQGQNFIVNIYRGVSLNASLGIADMLYGTLTSLSYNMLSAFNPPIVKSYAAGEYHKMSELISNSTKLSFLLLAFVSIPFILNIDYILFLWLGKVPQYVSTICIIALSFNCIGVINSVISNAINATGRNQRKALIIGVSMLLGLVVLWLTFKFNLPIEYSFISFYVGTPIMLVGCLYDAKKKIPFINIRNLIIIGLIKPILVSCCTFFIVFFLKKYFFCGVIQFIITSVLSAIIFLCLTYLFCLDNIQRKYLKKKIRLKISYNE